MGPYGQLAKRSASGLPGRGRQRRARAFEVLVVLVLVTSVVPDGFCFHYILVRLFLFLIRCSSLRVRSCGEIALVVGGLHRNYCSDAPDGEMFAVISGRRDLPGRKPLPCG